MNEKFLEVRDVMQILGISRSAAYKLMRQINSELEKKEALSLSYATFATAPVILRLCK